MENTFLGNNLEISRIVHGHWRLAEWNLSSKQLINFIKEIYGLGINAFDHADIYGGHTCEKLFGNALSLEPSFRHNIKIITKCGIVRVDDKNTGKACNNYDYSFEHIVSSVENSLKNFGTDYIDLLLLHRPSPFTDPTEIAEAFDHLKTSGKVLNFGVSNFNQGQFEMLESYLNFDLVTNQVEISPLNIEHFTNGNIDFFLKKRIKPMAWSPLGGGKIFRPSNYREHNILSVLKDIANELDIEKIETVAYAWLLKHPVKIIPVTGSGNIERIKTAVKSLDIKMSLEQWFRIYVAANGEFLP